MRKKVLETLFILSANLIVIGCGPELKNNASVTAADQGAIATGVGDLENEAAASNDLEDCPPEPDLIVEPVAGPVTKIIPSYAALASGGGSGSRCCSRGCELGQAGHNAPDLNWYVVNTQAFPDTEPLSIDRNFGYTKGSVEHTDTGLKINSPGSYWVSFSATMAYFSEQEGYTPLIPIFLIKNDVFDPTKITSYLGFTQSMERNLIFTFDSSGIMVDLAAGDTLSLVITNGGSPQPEPITVLAWGINIYKICD